jgi:transposase
MSQPYFDAGRSLTALEQDSTIIAVIEMSQSKWLVAALVPGVERHPLNKLNAQEEGLFKLLHRWRNEASQAGREIKRIVVAYEAGGARARCNRSCPTMRSSRRGHPMRFLPETQPETLNYLIGRYWTSIQNEEVDARETIRRARGAVNLGRLTGQGALQEAFTADLESRRC